jgi:hypothetical protein
MLPSTTHARRRAAHLLVLAASLVACRGDVTAPRVPATPRAAPSFQAANNGPPPTVSTTRLPNGQVGRPYFARIAASGRNLPLRFALTAGTLPAGLTLNPNTGEITGTPTAAGGARGLVVTVTDSKGNAVATPQLAITIVEPSFGIFILGPTGPVPGPNDRSANERRTLTLHVRYIKNGQTIDKNITLVVPPNARPDDILTALLPAVQRALGDDFDVMLITGAASPRIAITAKAGVTLGSNRPEFTRSGAVPEHVVTIGRLRISVALLDLEP